MIFALATAITQPGGIVMVIVASTPLWVTPITSYFDKEQVRPLTWVGSVLAVAGLILLAAW